jgi:hypothetical protein
LQIIFTAFTASRPSLIVLIASATPQASFLPMLSWLLMLRHAQLTYYPARRAAITRAAPVSSAAERCRAAAHPPANVTSYVRVSECVKVKYAQAVWQWQVL